MFRTTKKYRRIVPALVGTAVLLAAVFALQAGTGSKSGAAPQLAAAQRTADASASRGSARTGDLSLAEQIAAAAADGNFGSPADAPDATTTTTAAPTTTTAAPTTTTTTARPATTTTVAKPKPKATTPPTTAARVPATTAAPKPVANTSGSANAGDICRMSPGAWCSLAKCESGDKNVNTGNGYYGYFQFSAQTWRAMGGTGLPSDNSAAKQLELAQKLQARSGWGQWPVCGRGL